MDRLIGGQAHALRGLYTDTKKKHGEKRYMF